MKEEFDLRRYLRSGANFKHPPRVDFGFTGDDDGDFERLTDVISRITDEMAANKTKRACELGTYYLGMAMAQYEKVTPGFTVDSLMRATLDDDTVAMWDRITTLGGMSTNN